mmetsp:Transcript_43835/g.133460  ORF Transcript_43835/g.133460 Transcript_43835/m.133460 type:complete len:347 (-) Transcript_43835:430-1470(-)
MYRRGDPPGEGGGRLSQKVEEGLEEGGEAGGLDSAPEATEAYPVGGDVSQVEHTGEGGGDLGQGRYLPSHGEEPDHGGGTERGEYDLMKFGKEERGDVHGARADDGDATGGIDSGAHAHAVVLELTEDGEGREEQGVDVIPGEDPPGDEGAHARTEEDGPSRLLLLLRGGIMVAVLLRRGFGDDGQSGVGGQFGGGGELVLVPEQRRGRSRLNVALLLQFLRRLRLERPGRQLRLELLHLLLLLQHLEHVVARLHQIRPRALGLPRPPPAVLVLRGFLAILDPVSRLGAVAPAQQQRDASYGVGHLLPRRSSTIDRIGLGPQATEVRFVDRRRLGEGGVMTGDRVR